jgi:hypothetical protein
MMRLKAAFAWISVASLGLSAAAHASGWLSAKGQSSPGQRQGSLSLGGTLDKAESWTLQGGANSGQTLSPDSSQEAKASGLDLGLGFDPSTFWSLSVDGNLSNAGNGQTSSGGTLSLGLSQDWDWFKPALTLTSGKHTFRATENSSVVGLFGRTISTKTSQSLEQTQGGLGLTLGLGDLLSLTGAATQYQYSSDPSDPNSVFQVQGSLVKAPASQNLGDLLTGLVKRDWSAGLSLALFHGITLESDYAQSESAVDGVWTKTVSADWIEAWGPRWGSELGWSKAVESGDASPLFSLELSLYFNGKPKHATDDED